VDPGGSFFWGFWYSFFVENSAIGCGFGILKRRDHSVAEFREKMRKKGFEKVEIEEVVADFLKRRFLDDARFCDVFVRDQILKKNGPRKILAKLRERGVDEEVARGAVFLHEEEFSTIAEKLAKKKREEILRRGKKLSKFEMEGQIRVFLAGRGFEFDAEN